MKGERKGRAPASRSKGTPRKRANSNGKKFPAKGFTNDASWYTTEGVPVVGANFAALQTIDPELWTGLRTENISHFEVTITPPCDENNSFWQKVTEFYTEIRESNAGAANYAPGVLADYELNLITAYAIFYDLARKIHAVAESDPNAELSAAIKAVAAGVYSYRDMANNFADRYNELMLRAKELEVFPIIPIAALKRLEYYFGNIFKDSDNGKPAYFTFHAGRVFWMSDIDYNKSTDGVTHTIITKGFGHNSDADTWKGEMDELVSIIDSMIDNPVITIMRGDIRRAFGASCMNTGVLTSYVSSPLGEARLDAELMSKMENANILTRTLTAASDDFHIDFDANDGTTAVTLPMDGTVDHKLNARANKDQVLINWHKQGAPSDAELCAITRMMTSADLLNSALSHTVWDIKSTDGLVLTDIYFVASATMSKVTYSGFGDDLSKAQGGDVKSMRRLMFYMSTLDHAPQWFTTKSNENVEGREYMWDIDNFAVLSRSNLHTITSRVIRSLFNVHVPRGEHGRIERQP